MNRKWKNSMDKKNKGVRQVKNAFFMGSTWGNKCLTRR